MARRAGYDQPISRYRKMRPNKRLLCPQARNVGYTLEVTALPDANLYVAVDRRVGGCAAPIVVRYKMTGR